MGSLSKKTMKRVLVALLAAVLIVGVAQAVSVDAFNKTMHSVSGADETQQTYLTFADRDDSTSTWVKRDYDLYGKKVDLNAQTIDGTLINDSVDTVESWEMTINIEGSCFINNAWVGTVEIHQYVGTDKEATQTLDLRNYNLDDVELDYLYDGDLLIPLQKGDYLVYHPSESDEFNIAPHSQLTMGMIFYFLDDLDLSDYTVDYRYYRDLTYGAGFIAFVVLAIGWVLIFAGWQVAEVSYRRAKRELDLKKSSLSYMSSIYSTITFVDLQNDELIPVSVNEKAKEPLVQGFGARQKILDIFGQDTTGPQRASVLEFVDTATLPARLEKDSIALEYESKTFGWSQVRFFAVDREEGKPLGRVLLTVQDINDEKQELERVEEHTARVELESSTRNAIVAGASNSMRVPLGAIDGLAEKILEETDDETVRSYARQIEGEGKLLSFLVDGAVDAAIPDAENIRVVADEYRFAKLIEDVREIVELIAADGGFSFETEVSEAIPERLIGDAHRIEQALVGIVAFVSHRMETKTVRLSAYGAAHDAAHGTQEHILFSVKADGSGMPEAEVHAFANFVSDVQTYGIHEVDDGVQEIEGIALLLARVGSKLQMVNDPGEGIELYFEVEQQIADGQTNDGS